MFVRYERAGSRFRFVLSPTANEKAKKPGTSLGIHAASVELPYDVGSVHPDILAVCAFLIAGPFATEELTFESGISPQLADAFALIKPDCKIGPVDPELSPRKRPGNGKPGLCFSGGADSTAAVALLPPQTELFFLKRITPLHRAGESPWSAFERSARSAARILLNRKSYHKSSEAGVRFCEALQKDGRTAFVIGSDLEYVRDPTGFPHHMSCSVPLLLMAESRNLDTIAWGTIGEAAYRFGSKGKYVDFAARNVFKHYNALFSALGLPFYNPVVGLSEVTTSRIALSSGYHAYVQSCSREMIELCGGCIKCFRKSLLNATVSGRWPTDKEFDRFFAGSEIRQYLEKSPIKLENVYAFVTSYYDGKHPTMLALKRRVRGGEVPVAWMTKYIPSYIDQAPAEYRSHLAESLSRFTAPMSEQDLQDMMSWDVTAIGSDPQVAQHARDLRSLLGRQSQL